MTATASRAEHDEPDQRLGVTVKEPPPGASRELSALFTGLNHLRWYPLTLIAITMPCAWVGGRLHGMQWRARTDGR